MSVATEIRLVGLRDGGEMAGYASVIRIWVLVIRRFWPILCQTADFRAERAQSKLIGKVSW